MVVLCLSRFLAVPAVFGLVNCESDCEDTLSCGSTPGDAPNAGGTSGRGGADAGGSAGRGEAGSAGSGGASGTSSGIGGSASGSGGSSSGAAGESGTGGAGGSGGTEPCDGACGGATPVCNIATDECVECTEEDAAACTGDTLLCDQDTNTCVECLQQTDCMDAAASRCSAGSCVPCSTNEHCSDISGKGVCHSGTCVQCTVADESACGANSCNPMTKQCTGTPRGSVGICRPCLADSECVGGNQPDPEQRCVQMEFQGVLRTGGFCLRRVAKGCDRPYQIPWNAQSLSGAPSEVYCGINQASVRCEAVLDLIGSRSCSGGADTQCGCARDDDGNCIESGQGGLCRTVGVNANQCTYRCGAVGHCPDGFTCTGSPTMYCQ
jgi:hypothetical protein